MAHNYNFLKVWETESPEMADHLVEAEAAPVSVSTSEPGPGSPFRRFFIEFLRPSLNASEATETVTARCSKKIRCVGKTLSEFFTIAIS